MKTCPKCALKYQDDDARCFVDGTELVQAPDEFLGRTLAGKYLVEQKLGEGGMAGVYRGRHVLVDRPVAIKILGAHVASNDSIKERFRREAKNAAALAHPNIVEIYDQGETEEGFPFLVMELLSGHALADRVASGPIPWGETAALAIQIAQGLSRAHDFGVIHRDLKPDNIFIANVQGRPTVKLLDFGIARSKQDTRLTSAGELFGTPQYMAPERLMSIDAGASQDLYALGVILFEMLTGKLPFEADTLPALFLAHMQELPPRPSAFVPNLPRRFEELVLGLLAKKPEDRPVDAHALIRELTALAPAELVATPPPAMIAKGNVAPTLPPTTLERWARRTAIFEEMLRRAHPGGAPPALAQRLDAIRAAIGRIHQSRSDGLAVQRKLDAIEAEARETRGRLGYAMQRIGEGLSRAREALRQAEAEMAPYLGAANEARTAYRAAAERVGGHGALAELTVPSEALGAALRQASEAHDRFLLAYGTSARAREFVESRNAEVADLEFQGKALREQHARVETEAESVRAALEQEIAATTRDVDGLQQQLLGHGSALVEALRPRSDLGDLFQRLEIEGGA